MQPLKSFSFCKICEAILKDPSMSYCPSCAKLKQGIANKVDIFQSNRQH